MIYNFNFDANTIKMLENMGLSLEATLRESGIPPRAVAAGNYELTQEQYKAFINAMDKYINAEYILEISKLDNVSMFVPEFFAGLCADSGMNCIKRISKYKKIVAPINMHVEYGDNTTSISYKYNDGDVLPKSMILNAQLIILSIIRQGTGNGSIKPVRISAEYDYPDNAIQHIGIQPDKSKNEIVFGNEDLALPFITENNRMWDYLESELNQRVKEMETDNSFTAAVRTALFEMIPGGTSDAERIAFELGMSKRTLQRKLKDEGTTYNQQLNHTRELLVRNYLRSGMSLDEIAFFVNYVDAKSLSRAFKVWTGMSVTAYRKEYVEG